MDDLLQQLTEASPIRSSRMENLIETFEGADACGEVLDEAALAKLGGLKGFPGPNAREMVLRAKVGHAGIVNRNKRFYPKDIMAREVAALQEKIQERSAFANDQHPRRRTGKDGVVEMIDQPTFGSTTFIPFTLEMNESGEVFSVGVVPKTDAGRNFAAVVRAGGRPGFSTRGGGSVVLKKLKINETQEEEVNVVQEDFKLKTFDTVIDQSVADATIRALAEAEVPTPSNLEEGKPATQPQSESESRIMKFAEWLKKYGEAGTALQESVKDGSITLADLATATPELHEALRAASAKAIEEEVQTKLFGKYEEYLESIKGELTKEQLEEAAAEGIAEFLGSVGIDAELAEALLTNEDAAEVFRTVLQEMAGNGGEGDPNPEGENGDPAPTNESIEEAVAASPALQALQEQLRVSQVGQAIAEAKSDFPYGTKLFDEHIKPLCEDCESPAEVQAIVESQTKLLRAAGSKEQPKASARFLPADSAIEEAKREDAKPKSLDEELIGDAATALAATATAING